MLLPINQTLSPLNKQMISTGMIYPDDWWTIDTISPIVAYQPYNVSNYNNSLINLANPGTLDAYNDDDNATDPDWSSANGWEFDGTGSLNTHINAFSYSNLSLIFKYDSLTLETVYLLGAYYSQRWHFGVNSTTFRLANGGTTTGSYGTSATSGVCGWSGSNFFQDGSKISSSLNTGIYPSANIQIGGLGYDDGNTNYRATFNCQAIAIYDQTLTDTQMQTLTTRLQGL